MRVLFVTPELVPLIKLGGIGEGLGALVRALRMLGEQVTVALPAHRAIMGVELTPRAGDPIVLHDGGGEVVVRVLEGRLPDGTEVLVFDTEELSTRAEIYGDDMHDPKNARRFALFSRAVVQLARNESVAGNPFDVLHVHEWPCAVVPYLAREVGAELSRTRTVITLHNLAHQGIFPSDCLAALGLGPEHAHPDKLGFHGHVNFMQGGILAADAITTVSPTYAREIQEPSFGEMLDGCLRHRADRLVGLLNGIDHVTWDPSRDAAIALAYDADDLSGKAACKQALLREVELAESERPLLVSVGRLVPQKGSDLLAEALSGILAEGVNVLVAGGGDVDLVQAMEHAAGREPGRSRYLGFVDDAMVHRLMAGADLVAMPSRFEPCGIVQLYALRYGAIPIAARTGGLADTIDDAGEALDEDGTRGTGFLYDEPSSAGLLRAVKRAVHCMSRPTWPALQNRAMRQENSWGRRAAAYRDLYRRLGLRR